VRDRKYKPWKPREKALLGKAPDRLVARKLGRSVRAVTFARQAAGIACFREYQPWTAAEITKLRAVPVVQFQNSLPALVRDLKRSAAAIRSRHRRELGLWENPKAALARRLAA
jgi:hypothetical protein